MEKFENKNKETKPFVADYDAVLNEVYLGLAREKDLPNSFGASNFEEYLSTNFSDDTERFKVEVMLGADFDRSIINKNFFIEFLKKDTTQHLILKYAGASTIPDLNH